MPQVEVAIGDREPAGAGQPGAGTGAAMAAIAGGGRGGKDRHVVALVFRVLDPPTPEDLAALREFAGTHAVEVWLQPKGPDTAWLLSDATGATGSPVSELGYNLPEFGLRIPFLPTEFTQVNFAINRQLLARAVRLLDLHPDEQVVDLFCGLGNFSLPIATRARRVIGIEGAPGLVARAKENAVLNQAALLGMAGQPDGVDFRVANLFEFDAPAWQALGGVDKLLIDPPRDGALAVAQVLAAAVERPRRVVYVSCNPATLARDVGLMVNTGGWKLAFAGVINMFPHTAHVESIAVLE
jgi:23S rRNA (uracil1939-C5)-methyltransferase